jgi:uncharacterized protein YqgV (UPF0045/DUF77 family)
MIAWFSIAPDDGSGAYSKQVAAAVRLIRESGFRYRLGAMGTEIEGPRSEVLALLARRHEPLATGHGVRRTETFIKIDDPIGAEGGQMERKVQAVERLV